MAPTNYPGALDTFPRPSPGASRNTLPARETVVFDSLADAVEAIEAILGTAPNGDYSTIREFLAALDIAVAPTLTAKTVTDDYTLILSDNSKVLEVYSAVAITVTIPPDITVPFNVGASIEIWQQGAGQVTIVQGAGVTVLTPATLNLSGQYATAVLRKRDTDQWALEGNLEA